MSDQAETNAILKEILESMRRQERTLQEIKQTGEWFQKQIERQREQMVAMAQRRPNF